MGWAASPGAGPRDGERVARRGRAWTFWTGVPSGHGGSAARTGPTTQSSTVQTPHCGGLCVPAAGPRGRRKGPAGLTPRAAGRAPGAGPGRRARPGRRPRCPPIARPYLFICKYITCAMIHVHSWSRGRVLQCEDPTETPRGRTDAHGPHASTRARDATRRSARADVQKRPHAHGARYAHHTWFSHALHVQSRLGGTAHTEVHGPGGTQRHETRGHHEG